MLGIVAAIAISWGLLYLTKKESILALGFLPVSKRLKQFFIGFFVTGILCVLTQFLEAYLQSSSWIINESITVGVVAQAFWWDVRSVFTEELIFRGALLYILIQKIGVQKSILISAASFGIYHWFSFGVLGNPMAMIFIFAGTGLMGYAWALAFAKTNSIMLPFGLHLGWNFTYNTVFSNGPLGELVLLSEGGIELSGWASTLNFLSGMIIVPILVLLYVRFFVKEEESSSKNEKEEISPTS